MGRIGYEYRYCFSAEDEIISKYPWHEQIGRRYVFEIRTNFIVKGRFDDENRDVGVVVDEEKVIGSEVFSVGVFHFDTEKYIEIEMGVYVGTRLQDYWMSDDEVGEFIRKALSFGNDQNGRKMIPICVDIDVCSVQQEGEPINAILDRAIKPECLYPTSLCPWIQISNYSDADPSAPAPDMCLLVELRNNLPTARVVDDGVMAEKECVVCLCRPIAGSQVTTLKCDHAFHYHCIAKWLAGKDTCPTCRHQAHDVFINRNK